MPRAIGSDSVSKRVSAYVNCTYCLGSGGLSIDTIFIDGHGEPRLRQT